jgi:ABC-type oligopeptide transport system substrate-binding subunit
MKKKDTLYPQHVLFLLAVTLIMACNGCSTTDPKGNAVYIRMGAEPNGLNPLTTEDGGSILITNQIFQRRCSLYV